MCLIYLHFIVFAINFLELQANALSKCLSEISDAHFKDNDILFIMDENDNITPNENYKNVIINYSRIGTLHYIKQKFSNYILSYDDDVTSLNETLEELRSFKWFNSRARYLFIAKEEDDIKDIAELYWSMHLYRSGILLDKGEVIELHEMDLPNSACGNEIKTKKVDSCIAGKLQNRKVKFLDPDMLEYYKGCTMNVIFIDSKPWVIDVNSTNNRGILIELLELVAERGGFKLNYRPSKESYRRDMEESYSFDTIYEDFENGYADILAAVGTNLLYDYFDLTFTVADNNIYFLVPKGQAVAFWKTYIKLFPPYLVGFGLLMFLSLLLLFHILKLSTKDKKRFRGIVGDIQYLYGVVLNLGVDKMPSSWRLRIVLIFFSFISMSLSLTSQAKLFTVMSHPHYEYDIHSVEELLQTDIPLRFAPAYEAIFLFVEPSYEKVIERYIPDSTPNNEMLFKMMQERNFATLTDRGLLLMYPNVKDIATIFPVLYFQFCLIVKKHHEMFWDINELIKRISEAGFTEKWASDIRWKYYHTSPEVEEDRFFKISLQHLEGACFLLVSGYCLAFVTFLLEIVVFRVTKVVRKHLVHHKEG